MIHPMAFIEALPGQWIRAGAVFAMEVAREGDDDLPEGTLVVMFATQSATSSLIHVFRNRAEAQSWAGELRETLSPPVEV